MSDLSVSLTLKLRNLLSRGLGDVRRDLKGIRSEADSLRRTRGAERLAGDMRRVGGAAASARREMGGLASETARLRAEAAAKGGVGGAFFAGVGRGALVAAGGTYALGAAFRRTTGEAISFEKAMAEVKKKVDGADDPRTLAELERNIKAMARLYGIQPGEMAGLTADAGAAGIATKDLMAFMRLTAKAAVGWDMAPREAAQRLAEIKSGLRLTIPQMEELGDKINMLGDTSPALERDIVEMFQRAGAAGLAAGADIDTSLAFLTGAKSMGVQPEIAARWYGAFTAALAKASTAKGAPEALKALGLDAKTIEKEMKTRPYETMIDVLRRLSTHNDKVRIATGLMGQQWFDETLRITQGAKTIEEARERLRKATTWKGSLNKGLAIQLATTDKHLERLRALAQDVGDRLGRWALPPINDAIQKVLDLLNEVDRRTNNARLAAEAAAKLAAGEKLPETVLDEMAKNPELATEIKRKEDQLRAGNALSEEARANAPAVAATLEEARAKGERDREIRSLQALGQINEKQKEIDALRASIEARRKAGAGEAQLGFSIRRIEELEAQIKALGGGRDGFNPSGPQIPWKEVRARETEVADFARKKAALDDLKAKYPEGAQKFDAQIRKLAKDIAPKLIGSGVVMNEVAGKNPQAVMTILKENAAAARAEVERLKSEFQALDAALKKAGKGAEQEGVFDPGEGKKVSIDDARNRLAALRAQLMEAERAAGEAAAAVKDKLSLDLTPEGQRVGATLAAGINASGAQAEAAARGVAARVKAAFAGSMAPVAIPARAEAGLPPPARLAPSPASAGSGGAGARTQTVNVGGIRVYGAGDPEKAARLVASRLDEAVRARTAGALHDGVA